MISQKDKVRNRQWGIAGSAILAALALSSPSSAKVTTCAVTAGSLASLQSCVNTAAQVGDATRTDTVIVTVPAGTYDGNTPKQQLRINRRKNLWIIGDTTADEATQPRILYQDRKHVYTDLDTAIRNDTSSAGTYGQNNGTVWIYESDNIRLLGLLIDGNYSTTSRTNTTARIFSYGATLGKGATVEIRGNVGVNILLSRNVQLRYLSVTNTWNGISIISPNLGGAFSFPDPNDPIEDLVATLPTSRAGRYGNHLVERCRIHDNTFGMLFQRDWDLSSVIRNNLFWGNYLRHWGDIRTPKGYVAFLETLDKDTRADGSARSLAYTTVGGAFLMTDVSLTPYRIHNNTFYNNATIFSGYYKTGTQHLFYNNLVGKPYQYFRSAADLQVQANDATYTSFGYGYTQTERTSEMLQYSSEHQRSNRVVPQDSVPSNTAVNPDYWTWAGGNLRLYNMRMIRTSTGGWTNARSWSNDDGTRDSLGMTWVPDTAAKGTIAQQSDTGGIVRWVRHNMWAGAKPDPMDPNVGQNWCPPWLPVNIRKSLGDGRIFRHTGGFDLRWTLSLPLDTTSAVTSASWLTPSIPGNLKMKGWPTYEGTATDTLAIGAYDPKGGWAAPARRIILRDTLIESVVGALVKFRMNVSGQGINDSDIAKLEVSSAKFYNDVPVSDTLYNQGPNAAGTGTTTRVNSILSSKPWPTPYQFLPADYNRPGYRVDDSLTKLKLRPDNIFLGQVGAGYVLPQDSLYARAEVVLKATLKNGEVIYSNPGVFMFSRPRFQFDVKVYDAITGDTLPLDADGISRIAQAHQPLKVVVKARTVAKLPVAFKGYSWLQMGSAGGLHGTDGEQLEKQIAATWSARHPNDTVSPYFAQNDSVIDMLRAMESPTDGTLKYSAIFTATDNSLLPYFIEGRSAPIKVVSGSIYQVTIDSVYRDSTPILTPKYKIKVELNATAGGKRDTLLTGATDTSANLANVVKGEALRVMLQVRDKFGNEVRDSGSLKKGLFIRLAHVLAPGRYSGVSTDPDMITIDSATGKYRSVRLEFDSLGRAHATINISDLANRSTFAALRAAIIDSLGREIGTPGASRDSGVADTAWLKTDRAAMVLSWVDTLGVKMQPIADGWVGSWYPVRVKLIKEFKGSAYTGTFPASALSPVKLHPAKGDTTTLISIAFAGDSLSAVVWVRANDSVTGAWILAGQDSLSDQVGGLNFRYPQVASSAFYDRDCDGKIDSVVVRMNGPLSFRAASGVVAGDTLDLKFPHQFLTPDAMGEPQRARLVTDSALAFGWNPAALGRADALANRVTIGNPLVSGKTVSYVLSNLKDLAPPVAISAFDQQSWNGGLTDSLVVKFSEAIDVAAFGKGVAPPFAVVRGGSRISMSAVKLARPAVAVDSGKYAFVFSGASGVLQKGDSLVIDGTSVSDLAGNLSGTTCPNNVIPLDFSPKYEPSVGWVLDVTGDGNADSVHLGFKDSLGTLPETILVKWGSPAETMTVTRAQLIALGVKTSDSAFTVPTVNWKGKDQIIDGDTVRNVPLTVGPMDSAWFDGGLSREWLVDRVPPVVIHSRLKWGSDPAMTGVLLDTLTVDFSEKVLGCAVGSDPGLCLTVQVGTSNLKFGTGSTILSTTGSRWTILVPRTTTSVKPSDSIGATPKSSGGSLYDVSSSNVPGDESPAAYVYGDPAPPRYGMMLDRNGDGRVDAVLLHYVAKPTVAKLPPFTFEWADSSGVTTVLRADSAFSVDSTRWIAVLSTAGAFPVTGYSPASVKMIGKQVSQTMTYPFPVRDSAGPVLKPKATLAASSDKSGYDTIVVWPSEALRDPTGSVLLEFRHAGSLVPAASVVFKSATRQSDGSWKVIVGPTGYRPSAGDDTRLSTSGSVTDTVVAANLPSVDHPWVPLSGNIRTPYASSYLDANKDGRIETATFDFASPVAIGTRIRVKDPAGTDAYREYVVTAADTGKTHLEFVFTSNPWGQDVTSLAKPNLGLMLAATGLDTSVFKGGAFDITDKVEPVITSAKLRLTSDTSSVDTLVLKVSEWVGVDPTKFVIRYRASGDLSDTGVAIRPDPRYKAVYDSAKGTLTLYLTPFPEGYSNPITGDSLRLSWDGVADKAGNSPGPKAKWTQVLANERVYPPSIHVTNPVLESFAKSGEKIPGDQFEVVGRESTQDGSRPWSSLDGSDWKSGSNTYTPGVGTNGKGNGTQEDYYGTVVFIQTNVPTTIKLYIYDIVGTFVGQVSQYISREMLDRLAKTTNSRTGMVDVGILWKGQREDGRLVASGIYPVRLLALREPVAEEKAAGKVNSSIYNRLVKVGVKLRLE